jgi:hypothetical protein
MQSGRPTSDYETRALDEVQEYRHVKLTMATREKGRGATPR